MDQKEVVTVDGFKKKNGDPVWERAWESLPYVSSLVPDVSIVGKTLADPNRCWDNYENCLIECNKYNSEHDLPIRKQTLNK